jgi:(S)-2-hydroxy-acid oxidase
LTWEDVKWLKRVTRLPIIVKGILTAEDAEIAIQYGVSGVFVSNHGARQLDTVLSSIDALPEIVKQVAGRCEVYLDGGVSTGSDAFKAIALGAKMAFLGRPLLWGLTLGGQAGAKKVLQIMKDEFDLTMALSGAATVDKITEDFLFRQLTSRL